MGLDKLFSDDEQKLDQIQPTLADSKPFFPDHISEGECIEWHFWLSEAREESVLEPTDRQKNIEDREESFRQLDEELKREFEQLEKDFRLYGLRKKDYKDDKGLTIPKPFKFLERESKSNIRKRKLEEMINQKRKEEEDALNFRFKANDVPLQVKTPM